MPSQMYLDMCDAEKKLHADKSLGYTGQDPDPWVNFRGSEKLGVEAWRGAMIRMMDKVARAISLANNPDNDKVGESFEDTMSDLSAYAKIVICLKRGDGLPQQPRQTYFDVTNQSSGTPEAVVLRTTA